MVVKPKVAFLLSIEKDKTIYNGSNNIVAFQINQQYCLSLPY